jgi:hypothetical protein
VRLHVDHRDPLVLLDRLRRDRLDVDVEQVDHPHVLRPRDALDRPDDRGRLRPPQHVAQRQPARHRVWVGLVVQHDQHALGVAEVPLVLLHPRARQRSAEFGEQRTAEQLRHREIRDVREFVAEFFRALLGRRGADTADVDERSARIAHRLEDFLGIASAVVFDDDAGAGAEIRFDPRFRAAGIAGGDGDVPLLEPPSHRALFDDEFDLEAGQEDLVEHPDDQFVLTNG